MTTRQNGNRRSANKSLHFEYVLKENLVWFADELFECGE
jgi:hypothetical protein